MSAAVHETACDRARPTITAVGDLRNVQTASIAAAVTVALGAFHDVPTVIDGRLPRGGNVDLFLAALPDIGDVEIACRSVESETPWITKPDRPDFGPRGSGVHVDPQHLAEERLAVLPMTVGIPPGAAVARPDVEHSVSTKQNVPAIVIRIWLVDREQESR